MATAPKRSLFNKPKWATAPATASSSGNEFYRHSGRVYKDILAENERKRQESLEKKANKDDESDEDLRDVKRRRLSPENEDGSLGFSDDDGYEDDVIPSNSVKKSKTTKLHSQVSTRSKGPTKSPAEVAPVEPPSRGKASSQTTATIIDLGDEGEEEEEPSSKTSPVESKPAVVQELSDDSDSDEYVRELKRKAREKRRNQLAVEANRASSTPDISRPASAISSKDPSHPTTSKDVPFTSTPPPPTAEDPICRILITSPIPNTEPLIIERRASQRLQEVRQYWCQRQNFTPEFTRTVFLTWRSHRLYDISTCRSLAEKADRAAGTTTSSSSFSKSRSFTDRDNDDDDIFSTSTPSSTSFMEKSKGQIAVEATTAELLEKAKQRQQNSRTGSPSSFHEDPTTYQQQHSTGTTSNPNPSAHAPRENDIRVLLRASKDALPGIPDPTLKLKVRASTPVWKVIAAFKDQRIKPARNGSVEGVEVTLMFDGEALDPNLTMGGTEVEDTDAVDVVVRFV